MYATLVLDFETDDTQLPMVNGVS